MQPYPIRFGFVGLNQPKDIVSHRAIAAGAWKIELTTPRKILETYKLWMITEGNSRRTQVNAGRAYVRLRLDIQFKCGQESDMDLKLSLPRVAA